MKKMMIGMLAAVTAVGAFAEGKPPAQKPMTDAEREAVAEKVRHFTGGRVVRPTSMKGKIVLVDLQKKLAPTNSQIIAGTFTTMAGYNVVYESGTEKWDLAKAAGIVKAHKGNVGVVIVDDATTPPMLVAPEEGWAVVNVAKLEKGLTDGKMKKILFGARCRKELMRAVSLVCGGGGSPYKGSAINAATVEDLDSTGDFLPFDTIQLYKPYLQSFGVTPKEIVTYRQAVMEGWAPEPANEYQTAAKARALADKAKRDAKKAEREAKKADADAKK